MAPLTAEEAWKLATSNDKLERDRAAEQVATMLNNEPDEAATMLAALCSLLGEHVDDVAASASAESTENWETKLGFLLLAKVALTASASSANRDISAADASKDGDSNAAAAVSVLSDKMTDTCLKLLQDREARVRIAAGAALGALCRLRGQAAYEASRLHVPAAIRSDLHREAPPANQVGSLQFSCQTVYCT